MKLLKNIWDSFLKLALTSALIHNLILLFKAIKYKDIKYINFFQILGLDEFWPEITKGWTSDLISFLIMLGIMTVFFANIKTKENRGHRIGQG